MNPLVQATLGANCATVTCVKIEDVEAFGSFLRDQGYSVYTADLAGADGETAMFLRIAAALPYGEFYERRHTSINLAALDDLLIDGLVKEGKIALLVTSAEALVERHLNLIFNLTLIFALQCQRLRSRDIPALFTTFLIGHGPNFVQDIQREVASKVPRSPRTQRRTQEEVDRSRAEHKTWWEAKVRETE